MRELHEGGEDVHSGSWDAGMLFMRSGEKVDLESNSALAIDGATGELSSHQTV